MDKIKRKTEAAKPHERFEREHAAYKPAALTLSEDGDQSDRGNLGARQLSDRRWQKTVRSNISDKNNYSANLKDCLAAAKPDS